jgi:hypothetical protein
MNTLEVRGISKADDQNQSETYSISRRQILIPSRLAKFKLVKSKSNNIKFILNTNKLSRIKKIRITHLAWPVLFGHPVIQVEYQNKVPSKISMHSHGLLHKVSKSSRDCALVVDKHHRGSRTHHMQHFSPHLVSRTPRTTPRHHHKYSSKTDQPSWSLKRAPGVDQEEEQGCQEVGARRQQGDQQNKIKQDKAATRTRSRRSRRAPDQSLIPTSLLQKFQQQGEQS